jgi:hypothetical protein
MRKKSIFAILVTLTLFHVSSLFAQTECELLAWPFAENVDRDLHSLTVVLDYLSSDYSHKKALIMSLSEEQRIELATIQNSFESIREPFEGEIGDDLDGLIDAKIRSLQNLAAPKIIDELARALGDHWPAVVFQCNRNMARGFRDPSGFTLTPVIDGLKLTEQQKAQLEKCRSKLAANQKKLKSELADKLRSILDEHFNAVKAELDSVQQVRFLKWFGDLSLFKSLTFSDRYQDAMRQASSQRGEEAVIEQSCFFDDVGKPINSPAIRRDFEIDTLLYCVLTMQNIENQLVLSPDQVQQIKRQIHGNDIRLVLKNRRTERMLAILDDKWELPEWLDDILLPHQKTWMQQFEFQVYILPYADSFGVLHPDVSESLRLNDSQKVQIKKMALDYRTKVTDLSRKNQLAIALAEEKNRAEILKLLSPEQLHQYRLWFGDMPYTKRDGV